MKNIFNIIFALFLAIGLILKKIAFPGGGLFLLIGATALTISYLIIGFKMYKSSDYLNSYKILFIEFSFYLALTLIGIIFRHQWWNLPFYTIIFKYIWALLTIGLIIQIILYINVNTDKNKIEDKKRIVNNLIIPLIFKIILAVSTFYTSTETFCKIYKPYSADELYEQWENE